jgi:hypothetical protein
MADENLVERQYAEYPYHGNHAIPVGQGFGGFARTLLAGLGVPVENRFGLKPSVAGAAHRRPWRSSARWTSSGCFAALMLECSSTAAAEQPQPARSAS